jgi:hypothetical protein
VALAALGGCLAFVGVPAAAAIPEVPGIPVLQPSPDAADPEPAVDTGRSSISMPEDNTIEQPSFEWGNSFTSGANRTVVRTKLESAPDGAHVATVRARHRGPYGIDNWPGSVSSTVAGATYEASGWVAATTPGTRHARIWMTVRQHRADGSPVRTWTSPAIRLTRAFRQLSVTAVPTQAGDYLDVFLSTSARSGGQAFYVDGMVLTEGLGVPDGYSAAEQVFADTFGGTPDYDLLDSWTFGLIDNTSGGNPWSASGEDPYWGSGTKGYTPHCNYDSPADEYSLPRQVSQSSTGAAYDASWADGTGLRITAQPEARRYNHCPYSWVSGAINTYEKQEFGGEGSQVYVQFKARMPYAMVNGRRHANGGWGGLWMLPGPSSSDPVDRGIDLVESGYLHGWADPVEVVASNLHTAPEQTLYDTGVDLTAGFHTYAVEIDFDAETVRFLFDGVPYAEYPDGPSGPMFLLINMHVAQAEPVAGWHTRVVVEEPMSMDVAEVQVFERPSSAGQ